MNLSKSRYCRGVQCKKMLWLEKYKPDMMESVNNEMVFNTGNMIHEVARYLFGSHINIEYTDNLSEMIKDTYRTIESYPDIVITEASFNYENNFCSVDILIKNGDKYRMYEVKSGTELKDIYIDDSSYQYYVLTSLGFKVDSVNLIHLNSDYVRHGELELDKLFTFEDITSMVLDKQDEVRNNIKEINEYMEKEIEDDTDISENCFKPYPCLFFKYCTRNLPEENVFNIASMQNRMKLKLYKNGIYSYPDLLKEDINSKYKQQIEFELYDKNDYIDRDKISEFLDTLTYPLYFLDFETYQMPIPLYDDVSPYMQIPFQYSLHYMDGIDGSLNHKEYLSESGIDPRRKLAESLVRDIPMGVCTLAYNMAFEKSVIKKLASIYPDLSLHLMDIYDNMRDLMIPFKNRWYYSKNMFGSYSIKYVLPALFPNDRELDYHNLDLIHNGSEAMDSFRNLENMDSKTQEYTRERLLRYCELDTYAMVKILWKLYDVIKDKNT